MPDDARKSTISSKGKPMTTEVKYGWRTDTATEGVEVFGFAGRYVHRPECDGHCLDEGECYACYYA